MFVPVGHLRLAPEGVAADREQAVDGTAHHEGDGHGDHQLDEAESAFVAHHRVPHGVGLGDGAGFGQPPDTGSELVQERKVVNSARERAPASARALRAHADVQQAGVGVGGHHQCVWTVPTAHVLVASATR
jgi:hypothetical protein